MKYLVMSILDWGSLNVQGVPLRSPIEGCDSFALVFSTAEQAEAYSKGRYTIYPVKEEKNES